ncbi:hypothetical protein G7085_18665 [Tessaracoccus sp. HDW20]|uniref:hypothetical protein n=1 Tax=Tessaracoccus coleopterorum TaxID=2714950 RepID=UPI0018D49459|nr:hypothetical protein [Tessaracoccus coleopterorum]NHB85891.1 hypothetical protein [Tessaracoccus coleopterorum]
MKHKWLAFGLTTLAALGAVAVAFTGQGGQRAAAIAVGILIAATLPFVRRPWWAWAVIGSAAVTAVTAIVLRGGVGLYLLPTAFLAAVAGAFDLAAPRKEVV